MASLGTFNTLLSTFVAARKLKDAVLGANRILVFGGAHNGEFMTTVEVEFFNHGIARRSRTPAVVCTSCSHDVTAFEGCSPKLRFANTTGFTASLLTWMAALWMSFVALFLAFHISRAVEFGRMTTVSV